MPKAKALAMVDLLVSRYDLTSQERVAMANLIRELVAENQALQVAIQNWINLTKTVNHSKDGCHFLGYHYNPTIK